MLEKVTSLLTNKDYYPTRCARIVNPQQVVFYWVNNVYPVDIYPSVDFNTGRPILVYIFEKEKTRDLYEQWKDRRNQEE